MNGNLGKVHGLHMEQAGNDQLCVVFVVSGLSGVHCQTLTNKATSLSLLGNIQKTKMCVIHDKICYCHSESGIVAFYGLFST